jgi:hypothetical protein
MKSRIYICSVFKFDFEVPEQEFGGDSCEIRTFQGGLELLFVLLKAGSQVLVTFGDQNLADVNEMFKGNCNVATFSQLSPVLESFFVQNQGVLEVFIQLAV